jgi:hypothetical protein
LSEAITPRNGIRYFTMTVRILKIVAVALATLSASVGANSTGAGSCGAGDTSINNALAGNVHVASTNGPLSGVGVSFSIGGTALTAGSTTSFPAGTDLDWSVDAAQSPFEGILVRVAASGSFTHVGDPALVDTAVACAGLSGVQGVDHFNKNAKTSVTGTTNFDAAGTVTVDIVVVLSLSQWASSSYTLSIESAAAPVDVPVDTPVDVPVDTPVETPAPVDTPVETPTPGVETPAPVDTPVDTPAPTPVSVPAPVADVPTDEAPTADGECPEGKGKKGKSNKGEGKGGMSKKDGKMMKCKKTPKEPKTPKAGKGGKGKGSDDDAVRRRK